MNDAHPQSVTGPSTASGIQARARRALAQLDAVLPDVDALYQDLHEHPELSGQEARTAAEVARRLEAEGYEVSRDVGGHGVVGLLRNGDGPTVLLRGDMDALPVEEKTGLPYSSRARTEDGAPVMHACGHDVHTACLVGTAAVLARSRDAWRGTLMVVGQPAEETLQGAKAMLDAGLYSRFGTPDAVLGQHTAPLPVGTFMHREGVTMMGSAHVRLRLFGRGSHGAQPELSVDPVVLGASVVMRLQTIVSRALSPLEAAVVTVGSFQAGTRANVIPDEAVLELTVRTEDEAVQARVLAAIERIAKGEAAASGAPKPPQVEVLNRGPVNRNDPELIRRVRDAHAEWFGREALVPGVLVTASEDFPFFAQGPERPVPIAYWFMGITPRKAWEEAPGATPQEKVAHLPGPHSSHYAPDREGSLRSGCESLTVAALACLHGGDASVNH
ncbi:peptidase M20D, amidohydrolase [Corallococcus coralloides DSM 2259]|uniref:Peptidase M20D, amidohydrolase n=1 Tax=Corallococcus coralloides (strain ATCC 25202 / DSM 2259 / NBRC 100086 / M2) TaxID=1144275 RepID=H8MYJ5_CORCM|nr:amidohydrolase [Corallococcus coralloides]AFE09052.1 peptidase M20D, amidohydrolase [Corallococcus coralloides DSM 2259]